VALPAFIVLGLWIVLQFVPAVGSIAATDQSAVGVAYMAHVGGFVAGIAMTFLFRPTRDPGTAV
jgi:membrane associated rhomboid family serine protease